jgi:hypothetical protein
VTATSLALSELEPEAEAMQPGDDLPAPEPEAAEPPVAAAPRAAAVLEEARR